MSALSSGTISVAFLRQQPCLSTDTTVINAEVATAVGYLIDGRRRYGPRPDPCCWCALPPSGAGAIGPGLSRSPGALVRQGRDGTRPRSTVQREQGTRLRRPMRSRVPATGRAEPIEIAARRYDSMYSCPFSAAQVRMAATSARRSPESRRWARQLREALPPQRACGVQGSRKVRKVWALVSEKSIS